MHECYHLEIYFKRDLPFNFGIFYKIIFKLEYTLLKSGMTYSSIHILYNSCSDV